MMAEIWKIEKDLCRCCHSEGIYQKLSDVFDVGERQGIFSDIIWRTLGIRITSVEEPLHSSTYSICDACIVHLKDATVFKLQIRECERIFQDMYAEGAIIKAEAHTEIKQEPDTDEQSMDTGHVADVFNNDDDEAAGNDDVHDDAPGGDETECELKIDIELCNEQPEAETKRRSARSRRAALKDTKTQPKIKSKPKAKKKNVALENGSKKDKIPPEVPLEFTKHRTDGRTTFSCDLCDQRRPTKTAILNHIITHHLGKAILGCPLCTDSFKSRTPMQRHLLANHGMEEVKINNKYELKPADKHVCDFCNKEFLGKMKLKGHIEAKHKTKKCPDCPAVLGPYVLARHRAEVHGFMHSCGACDYKSVIKNNVLLHQRKVHLKERNVCCTVCGAKFFGAPQLKNHMISHNPVKKFECTVCKKMYPRKDALREHMKIHLGDKRRVCKICGEKFVQTASLSYHMGKHHPGAC
ncbi:zinc finger protein 2 isoform X1 [Amyelois transitella]|uniref:zinc finger protein 2 isoform X1 n=1 Tax=Amyelois transitella TaxID=680683 RepID=UPI00298FEEC6|nr:zinc finger protein 2 isoform X1 [Amyelois transitella]